MPHRQGKRQPPLFASKPQSLLYASSTGRVGTAVGVNTGVGVCVAGGTRVSVVVTVGDALLTGKDGVTGGEVGRFSVERVQPAIIAMQSNKLNQQIRRMRSLLMLLAN